MNILYHSYNEGVGYFFMEELMEDNIRFQEDTRNKLLHGAYVLKESVKGTLGPCGHHAILEKGYGSPLVSNDGVTIAKALRLENPYEQMGVDIILESAVKTNEVAGDGTTTSILLAYELLKHGYDDMAQGGIPNAFVEGMEAAGNAICDYVREHSHKIDTYEGIQHIATISAKSKELGTLVADALKQVEDPRCISCESGKSYQSKLRIQEGMELDARPLSPYFFAKDQMNITLKEPLVLMCNERIESLKQIEHFLAYAIQNHRSLLILCEDMENEVLAPLLMAHMQKNISIVVMKAPSFGSYQQDILDDLALVCKGKACIAELGTPLEEVSMEVLGTCKEALITQSSLQILTTKDEAVEARIRNLKMQLPLYTQPYDQKHVYHRISRLQGKIAILEIGGYTQGEIEEKKMRCEDALQAAYAAMEEGIVAGGGLAFVQAYRSLQPTLHSAKRDQNAGISCVFAAILKPFLQLMENNYEDGVRMLGKQFEQPMHIGYDVLQEKWCNLEEAGVLDPVKVVCQTLHNAISVASLLIRCDVALLKK